LIDAGIIFFVGLYSPVHDLNAPAGGFGVPPTNLLAYLLGLTWTVEEILHHFIRRYRRLYGVYNRSSSTGMRSNFRISQFIPSLFWDPVNKCTLSLRVELPTTIHWTFLAFAPRDRPAERYPLHLDGNRRRNNNAQVENPMED
jgi:hypothetical protein